MPATAELIGAVFALLALGILTRRSVRSITRRGEPGVTGVTDPHR
ncbi:hypothetical protein [Streptomyces sp. LaPpAH-108]|nr:hypothetical protein [Streptomyces sp. LaPpAH-108]